MAKERFSLNFSIETAGKPIISSLIKNYQVDCNILNAKISAEHGGTMFLELTGQSSAIVDAVEFLSEQIVDVKRISRSIIHDSEKCISCGSCTAVCPSGTLKISAPDFELKFDEEKCIICGSCIKACPFRLFRLNRGE